MKRTGREYKEGGLRVLGTKTSEDTYRCHWCGESIPPGEVIVSLRYNGDFLRSFSFTAHEECEEFRERFIGEALLADRFYNTVEGLAEYLGIDLELSFYEQTKAILLKAKQNEELGKC